MLRRPWFATATTCLVATGLVYVAAAPGFPHGLRKPAPGTVAAVAVFVLALLGLARLAGPRRLWATVPALFVPLFGLALVKIWLVSGQQLQAIAFASHDDELFANLGHALVHGDWLGTYNSLTLAKGPFYPMYLAACRLVHLPLPLAQHLLYVLACATLLAALRPLVARPVVLVALYAVLLFNPMSYASAVLRVIRDGIYPAETLLVISCLVGLYGYRDRPLRQLAGWAVGLGLALAAFWLTREEAVWLAPAGALLLGAFVLRLVVSRPAWWAARLALLVMPVALWGGAEAVICAINQHKYGVYTSCEHREANFLAAYGALCRVEHDNWQRFVPVPREVRERIYAVSPTFKELQPILEGELGRRWQGWSRDNCADTPPGEIARGWFSWALRNAVLDAGYYKDGKTASAFYARLADEVNRACDSGRLPAGPRRDTMMPRWRQEHLEVFPSTYVRACGLLVTFAGFDPQAGPSGGHPNAMALFRNLTKARLSAGANEPPGLSPWDETKLAILRGIGTCYQRAVPWAALVAAAAFLAALLVAAVRRRGNYLLVLEAALLVAVLARLGVLTLMEISTGPILNPLYLASAYPLLLAFIGLGTVIFFPGVARIRVGFSHGGAAPKVYEAGSAVEGKERPHAAA
jgi:hypothetical protein